METYEIAPFVTDITPPVGYLIAFGVNEKVDSKIYVRGVVIDDSVSRIIIASADVLYFDFSAYDKMVAAMAAYNEASCAYVCTEKMVEEGGYEPTTNYLTSEIEARLKAVIKALLS